MQVTQSEVTQSQVTQSQVTQPLNVSRFLYSSFRDLWKLTT